MELNNINGGRALGIAVGIATIVLLPAGTESVTPWIVDDNKENAEIISFGGRT